MSKMERVRKFLQTVQSVRVLIDSSPCLGNQAATLNLIGNLRRLGFGGEIHICADDRPELADWKFELFVECGSRDDSIMQLVKDYYQAYKTSASASTLSIPMPEVNYDSDDFGNAISLEGLVQHVQQGLEKKGMSKALVEAIEADPEDPEAPRKAQHGKTGAGKRHNALTLLFQALNEIPPYQKLKGMVSDLPSIGDIGSVEGYGKLKVVRAFEDDGGPNVIGFVAASETSQIEWDELLSKRVRTDSLLLLNPFQWYSDDRTLLTKDGHKVQSHDLGLLKTATYVEDKLSKEPLQLLQGPIQTIAASAKNGESHLQFWYANQYFRSGPDVLMTNAIRAAHVSQRVVVIAVVWTRGDFSAIVDKFTGEQWFAACDVSESAKIAQQTKSFQNQGAGVLVLKIGKLTKLEFGALLEASTAPVILEGAGTSAKCAFLGKPYLSVCTSGSLTPTKYVAIPEFPRATAELEELERIFNESGNTGDQLSKFFFSGEHELLSYFEALGKWMRSEENDQVLCALSKLAELR